MDDIHHELGRGDRVGRGGAGVEDAGRAGAAALGHVRARRDHDARDHVTRHQVEHGLRAVAGMQVQPERDRYVDGRQAGHVADVARVDAAV